LGLVDVLVWKKRKTNGEAKGLSFFILASLPHLLPQLKFCAKVHDRFALQLYHYYYYGLMVAFSFPLALSFIHSNGVPHSCLAGVWGMGPRLKFI